MPCMSTYRKKIQEEKKSKEKATQNKNKKKLSELLSEEEEEEIDLVGQDDSAKNDVKAKAKEQKAVCII